MDSVAAGGTIAVCPSQMAREMIDMITARVFSRRSLHAMKTRRLEANNGAKFVDYELTSQV